MELSFWSSSSSSRPLSKSKMMVQPVFGPMNCAVVLHGCNRLAALTHTSYPPCGLPSAHKLPSEECATLTSFSEQRIRPTGGGSMRRVSLFHRRSLPDLELWFAKIRSARNRLTCRVMDGKNRRHATAFTIRVSIRPLASQRTSGRCDRERSAPNADSSVSTKTEAPSADDLGSDILGRSPQRVVRLATSLALCPGRHRRPLAARTVPQILGQVVQPAAAASRSPRHRRRTPPLDRANSRRQSVVARTQDSLAS
jgi:hypothetical protein